MELLKPYKHVVDYEFNPAQRTARVSFESAADAKVALAGLSRFRVDEQHTLTANFAKEKL